MNSRNQNHYHQQLSAHHKPGATSPVSAVTPGSSNKSASSPSDSSNAVTRPGGVGPSAFVGAGLLPPQGPGPSGSQGVQPGKTMMPPPSPALAVKEADAATSKPDGSLRGVGANTSGGPLTPGPGPSNLTPALSPSQILSRTNVNVNGANNNLNNGVATSRPTTASTNPSATPVQTPASIPASIPPPLPTTMTSTVTSTTTTPAPPQSSSTPVPVAPSNVSSLTTPSSNSLPMPFSDLALDTMPFDDLGSMFGTEFGLTGLGGDDFSWLTTDEMTSSLDLPH